MKEELLAMLTSRNKEDVILACRLIADQYTAEEIIEYQRTSKGGLIHDHKLKIDKRIYIFTDTGIFIVYFNLGVIFTPQTDFIPNLTSSEVLNFKT